MRLQILLAGASLAICAAGGASAQTVVADGGFDSQAASVAQYCYDAGCPSGSWTLSGGGFVRQGNIDWPAPVPVSPAHVLFLQGNQSAASQSVSVVLRGRYVVVYSLASRHDFGSVNGNQTVGVELAGQSVARNILSSDQPFRRYVSAPVALAAGTSYILRLTGNVAQDSTAFVDNVSIVPAESTINYSYDALGRLTGVGHAGGADAGTSEGYTYDQAGNRTHVSVFGAP